MFFNFDNFKKKEKKKELDNIINKVSLLLNKCCCWV